MGSQRRCVLVLILVVRRREVLPRERHLPGEGLDHVGAKVEAVGATDGRHGRGQLGLTDPGLRLRDVQRQARWFLEMLGAYGVVRWEERVNTSNGAPFACGHTR